MASDSRFPVKNALRTVTELVIYSHPFLDPVSTCSLQYGKVESVNSVTQLSVAKYLHPFENLSEPDASFGLPANTINFYISGSAGKLGAWDIPGKHVPEEQDSQAERHAHLKDGSPIVLYFHGQSNTRGTGHRLELYKVLTSLGYHTITIDYRGFGDSDGRPSENGLIDDGVAAMEWIRSQSSDAPIYIWGHSLGSGVAGGVGKILCDKGSPPAGIILEAPFNNLRDAAAGHFLIRPFRSLIPYLIEEKEFRTDKRLKDVYCPILILHDRDDWVVPFELGKTLYEGARNSGRHDPDRIKFEEFNGHGHKLICRSERLRSILR